MTAASQDVRTDLLGHVATITLDRPASLNGLTPETCHELAVAISAASADSGVRCIVLTGAGTAFCSGLDLKSAAKVVMAGGNSVAERERALREDFHGLIGALRASRPPVIARIAGACVGFGFDMALACDMRFGVRLAKYGAVFTRIGLIPDGGGSWTLQRLVGPAKAMELVLTARTFDGAEGERLGVLNRCLEDVDALDAVVNETVAQLVSLPPLAVQAAKRLIRASQDGPLSEALAREATAQLELLASQDTMAALAAFYTKKPAIYHGR
jgi:enoyl-CoA hydratase/carnithine racemase